GFMGSINGSALSNVVSTGAFTIPLMKKVGYHKDFAGAVEASASVGGQILPPIMGASAFIMAETTGLPYSTIALAAL
ncbi:TRAP transporter large permease subunit, partial [Pseudoalteromonas sp. SIMBA_153]